ncbi:hypothetical protein CF335_g9571, partial [Tilletia laevis]
GSTVSIGTKRNETTFTTSSKDMFVKSSLISILSSLPTRANVTVPPEYKYLSYLRYRHASGPSKSMSADCGLGAVVYAGYAGFGGLLRPDGPQHYL